MTERPDNIPRLVHPVTEERWMIDAECRSHPPDMWFPPKGDAGIGLAAKAVCAVCPVNVECLTFAVKHNEVGIWGGLTAHERRAGHRTPPAPQPHGDAATFRFRNTCGCPECRQAQIDARNRQPSGRHRIATTPRKTQRGTGS